MSARFSTAMPTRRFFLEHGKPFSHEALTSACSFVNPALRALQFSPPSAATIELFPVDGDLVPADDILGLLQEKRLQPLSSDHALLYALHHAHEWVRGARVVACPAVALPLTDDLGDRAIVCEMEGNWRRIFLPPSKLKIAGVVWVAGIAI